MKVDNVEGVTSIINIFNNRRSPTIKNDYDEHIPVIAYKSAYAVGDKIKSIFSNLIDLQAECRYIAGCELHPEVITIDIDDALILVINKSFAPAVYIKDTKHICYLQALGAFKKYIVIDDNTILTNSTFHSMDIYRKYLEFASKSDITAEDILVLIKEVYEIALKYTPVIKNIDELASKQSSVASIDPHNPDYRKLDIDLEKYKIENTHTALTTGEWSE